MIQVLAYARLAGLRLSATEDRIEAELALGHHSALVPELEVLVAREPTRERLGGQLMLALYRSGRQADALAAYRAARSALVEKLVGAGAVWVGDAGGDAVVPLDPASGVPRRPVRLGDRAGHFTLDASSNPQIDQFWIR